MRSLIGERCDFIGISNTEITNTTTLSTLNGPSILHVSGNQRLTTIFGSPSTVTRVVITNNNSLTGAHIRNIQEVATVYGNPSLTYLALEIGSGMGFGGIVLAGNSSLGYLDIKCRVGPCLAEVLSLDGSTIESISARNTTFKSLILWNMSEKPDFSDIRVTDSVIFDGCRFSDAEFKALREELQQNGFSGEIEEI